MHPHRRTRKRDKKRYTYANQPNQPFLPLEETVTIMADYPHLDSGEEFNQISSILERLAALEARMTILESSKTPVSDELGDKILVFLKEFPGIKFNTGSIAANIGMPTMKLSDKLRKMAEKNLIRSEKEEGHSAMYWYTAALEKESDG